MRKTLEQRAQGLIIEYDPSVFWHNEAPEADVGGLNIAPGCDRMDAVLGGSSAILEILHKPVKEYERETAIAFSQAL